MKQKFLRSTFVRVRNTFDAIVDGTYSQQYCGEDTDNYSLFKIRDGNVVDHIAWYDVCCIEALPAEKQDQQAAEEMIEKFNLRHSA